MGFFITEEKELPEFSNQDANKVLKVDSSGLYLQWLQETTSPAELPSQTGNANRLLTTNGTTPSWTDAPSVSSLTCSGNIILSADSAQLRRTDNTNIILQDAASTRTITLNVGNNSFTRRRLFVQQGTVTVENSVFNVTNPVIHTISGVLNLNTAGSSSAPTLMFGDNTATPVASRTGIWGSDNAIRFGTDGAQRVVIQNDGVTIPDGNTTIPGIHFAGDTGPSNSGIVKATVGSDVGIGFVAAGTQVCTVVGGNIRLSGGSSIRNNVSNPSANIQFIGSTGGATGYIQSTFSDNTTGTVATYRLGNGTNWPATETVMSRLVGGTGTNEIFATEHGNTYFRFLGATGTGASLPARVQRVEINNSGMIVSGQLNLNTAGSAAAPALLFGDSTVPQSGIYGGNDVINISTGGTERMRIGQNFNDHFQTVTTNIRFQTPDGNTGGYRFANSGDNRVVCNSNVVSLRAQGVNTLSVSNSGTSITGNLSVTGTISGTLVPSSNTINVLNIQFGGTGASMTGANSGVNSSVNIQTEAQNRVNVKSNDTEILNSLNISRGIISPYLIIDEQEYTVARTTPAHVILTRSTIAGAPDSELTLPAAADIPLGFGFRLYIFNLPGRSTSTNEAIFRATPASNNPLIFTPSTNIRYFVGNAYYTFTSSTVRYMVLDFYNMRDWAPGKARWIITPVSQWIEPSPSTTVWLGNDN